MCPQATDPAQAAAPFVGRHIGSTDADAAVMLKELGISSVEELLDAAIPVDIRLGRRLDLPAPLTETDAQARLLAMASQNAPTRSLIGLGYYNTVTPAVIRRNVLESPAWYTAYTPYQPEISQGRLEALLAFQTMVCDLTGLDISNASLLDEATAASEAMTMCLRSSRGQSRRVFLDQGLLPQTIDVVATRAEPIDVGVVIGDPQDSDFNDFSAVVLASITADGLIQDIGPWIDRAHAAGALTVVTTDPLASVILTSPGALGADIAVGSTQRFGVPVGFGGPHAGFIACRSELQRALPGRLVGVSIDSANSPAYRLTLQTREQHIRRERATSNICTAQVLLANVSALYAMYHGAEGLEAIARGVQAHTVDLATRIEQSGFGVIHRHFFDTLVVSTSGRADQVHEVAAARGFNLRAIDGDLVGLSLDELTNDAEVSALASIFTDVEQSHAHPAGGSPPSAVGAPSGEPFGIPAQRWRTDEILTHELFNSCRSETEMMRYLRSRADRDLALDRAMIPLGSCTMKLNAAAEMEPISWPALAQLHPFVPAEQAAGYGELIGDLEDWLAEITGYDAVSLQPNAGSQGELAGLLAIRAYHRDRGEPQRNVCLIPSSAHGTNAASAVMAGMTVAVVACDDSGNVDIGHLRTLASQHADRLAALMITYPSTHGVFEAGIREICEVVHEFGGQVYTDGANLNAVVGFARPGDFGSDVSHLNLHKTFCIPHGGGGPGIGPIGVKAHLAPYLPNHPIVERAGPATGVGAIAAAPWGSAGILAIPWMYIQMMGADGLKRATERAILHANYIAARLRSRFDILFTGQSGWVAHECIIDLRDVQSELGITVEDVAKRLIDYGFHAPTVAFPVAGTLMIEPTESESLAEIDRFCDAMDKIADEIDAIRSGAVNTDDSPLRRAPHTSGDVTAEIWTRPYSRQLAAFPAGAGQMRDKYWPPVGRINNAFGDRNPVCTCPPPSAFAGEHL